MAAPDARHKLLVIAGLHKGAELLLQEGEHHAVGSSEQCDIVLLDAGIAAEHLCLSVTARQAYLFLTNLIFENTRPVEARIHSPRLASCRLRITTVLSCAATC
jgi:hypothetical protein